MGKYVEVQVSNHIKGHRRELAGAFRRIQQTPESGKIKNITIAKDVQTIQRTLGGYPASVIPKIRTTDGHLIDWDRNAIVNQLLKETKLSEQFYGEAPITEEEARDIAKETEKRIKDMGVKFLSGPLVRELVNIILLERGHIEWRNISTRVGTPVYDAYKIDMGTGFEARDNANLQENAETSHKKKADKMSKEQYLLMLPPRLADAHLNGDIHIHDLEYLGTRAFCIDGCTAIPVKSGDGISVIRPDELAFEGEYYYPEALFAITPSGYRKIEKISRRKVKEGELLKIKTTSGKSLKVTKEHRLPVKENEMVIKRAEEVKEGDILYGAEEHCGFNCGFNIRGEHVNHIDLIKELTDRVPAPLLENVFVRGLRQTFEQILDSGKSRTFSEISKNIGIEHAKEWFTRGIMPVTAFRKLCDFYDLEDYTSARVGVIGSEHELPAILPITSELIKLIGFFISEGNYNIADKSYNLAITENQHVLAVQQYAMNTLNTYATMVEGGGTVTKVICGIEGEWKRARQVYFGGKLGYLLFKYIFGIPDGSSNKRLPDIVYNLNDELLHDFLSSLFTGDGSAYYRPDKSDCIVNYTTTSEMLRQELSLLLISLGMHPQIVELYGDERKTLYRIQLNGFRNIEIFNRNATFYNSNQGHIIEFMSNVKETRIKPKSETVKEITQIQPSGEYVYDVFLEHGENSAEADHTFFASDGLLIHNCQDWDLRYFFYYGLMPDGSGTKASVAGPAKKPEVAILHAVKALGSAQTNFSVAGDEDILIKGSFEDTGGAKAHLIKIGEFVDRLMSGKKTYPIPQINGEFLDITGLNIKAAAFNPDTLKIEYKTINRIIRHPAQGMLYKVTTQSGRVVSVTGAHSIFILDDSAIKPVEVSKLKIGDYVVIPKKLPADAVDEDINIVQSLIRLPDELISDVYIIGASDRIAQAHEIKSDWKRRDRVPLLFINQNHINIDTDHTYLGMSRSPHTIPSIIKASSLPVLSRLLGYFAAEGHITFDTDKNVYSVVLSFGSHETDTIEDAKAGIKEVFGMDVSIRKPHPSEVQLVISNKLMAILFRDIFGTGTNSTNKRISQIIFNTTEENKLEFLAGYYCDGSMHRREISYKTVTKKLASDLLYLLLQIGIVGKQKCDEGKEHTIGDRTIKSSIAYNTTIAGRGNIKHLLQALPLSIDDFEYSSAALTTTNPPVAIPLNHAGVKKIVESTNPIRNIPELGNLHKKKHLAPDRVKKLLAHIEQTVELNESDKNNIKRIETIANSDLGFDIVDSIQLVESATEYVYDLSIDGYENFIGGHGAVVLHNSGGQGFYNFLTFMAPYFEGMGYEEIEQLMQMFVYEMTQMMVARGGQLVFSSVQLSPGVPGLWRDKPVVYKGRVYDGTAAPKRTYGEFEREVRLSFEALMNVMLKGDYWGKPFNFPKPEISIEPDFMEENDEFNRSHPEIPSYDELYTKAFELAAKYGAPYFDNQLPEYRGAGKGISCYQCCAYNFSSSHDKDSEFEDKMYFKDGKHFSMGAWQVVSVNCPRAAYKAKKDDEQLFRELKNMMDMCVELFKIKRKWMDIITRNNRMPFATQRPKDPITQKRGEIAVDLKGLVYTIGVVGINEMVQYHTGKQVHESEDARRLAIRAMFEMKFYAKELGDKNGMEIALARTPAETTAQRFAVSDLLHKEYRKCTEPLIKGNVPAALSRLSETRDLPVYYTNGTHVPPGAEVSLPQRIKIEEVFFPIVDGGNILHIWLGEAAPDPRGLKEFAMNIAKNTQVGYFAFTRDMTVCMDDFHVASGLLKECPNCESENVEHLSRVTGYIQAVSGWNDGKKQELKDRKRYGVGV